MTATDVDAIMSVDDLAALAEMKGYASSYFAASGMIVMGAALCAGAAAAGRARWSVGGAVAAGIAGLGVIEARRRARQWEAAIDVRILHLTATPPR